MTTPHTPRPAPMALTIVDRVLTALVKNPIYLIHIGSVICFDCPLRKIRKQIQISPDPSPMFSFLHFYFCTLPLHKHMLLLRKLSFRLQITQPVINPPRLPRPLLPVLADTSGGFLYLNGTSFSDPHPPGTDNGDAS